MRCPAQALQETTAYSRIRRRFQRNVSTPPDPGFIVNPCSIGPAFQAKPSVKSVTQQEEEQPIYPEEANSTDTALWPPRGYHRKPMQFRPDSMTSACIQSIGKEAAAAQPDGDQACNAERKAGSCIPAMLETSIQPSFIVNTYSVRRAGMTPYSPAWCNAASGRLHFQLPAAPGTSRKPSRARRCRLHRK